MISDTAPPPGRFPRLYFLPAGKSHAPVDGSQLITLPRVAESADGKRYFTINDIDIRINPAGDKWGEQVGRTVSYIVNWFNRGERRFPNDPDRFWYIWGFDASK